MVPHLAPMLAGYGAPSGDLDGWAVEPKFDGWRAHVEVDAGHVRVRTRSGRTIDVPELGGLADLGRSALLDGELVAAGGRAADFYAVAPNLARRNGRRERLTFVAFDVLWLDDQLTTSLTYDGRRGLLEGLDLDGAATIVRNWPGSDSAPLLAACEELGVEGVVLKRRNSTYTPGRRSTAWRKLKCANWRDEHASRRRPRHTLQSAG